MLDKLAPLFYNSGHRNEQRLACREPGGDPEREEEAMLVLCLVIASLWLFVDLFWRTRGISE